MFADVPTQKLMFTQDGLVEPTLLKILVLDDHHSTLIGTIEILRKYYPEATIFTAKTAQDVLNQVEKFQLNFVVIDLQIPETPGMTSEFNTGVQLLQKLMKKYPNLNAEGATR
jgi:DNA-binding NarL/FixJ family response regulator